MEQKSFNEIVQSIINNIHDTLPEADTKEGTFIRDVFINPSANELASVYSNIKLLELSQSVLTATNSDLDKLAANYFVFRKQATFSYGKLRFYISNTNRLGIDDDDLPLEIVIPKGTIVSTIGTYTKNPITAKTTESFYASRDKIKLLPIDILQGSYRFIEVPAITIEAGESGNVGESELIQLVTNITPDIAFVRNPYSFSGGTNQESDNSLSLRIKLAISGSNIGTKDGYLSYILKQNGVTDAIVIGAEDTIMFRDGGYINDQGDKIQGLGGMVDIYIRGQLNEEEDFEFKVDTEYINGNGSTQPYAEIKLPKQPVNNIVSIISEQGTVFVNASDYEIEKSIITDTDGKIITNNKYYRDIEWDFSLLDTFQDTEYYPLPTELNSVQIKQLKSDVDAELRNILVYMNNINYSLNWGLIHTDDTRKTALFDQWFYNGKVYKITAHDSRLNGRTFIKKDNKIHIRIYRQPDFILIKDNSTTGNSVEGKDSIKWLNGNKPLIEDNLIIKYNYDRLIKDLQNGMETKRVLTADVLIKRANKLSLEIILEAVCYSGNDPLKIKKQITNNIVGYVNSTQSLGGSIDRSDIIAVARQTDGVDSVNVDNIAISELGFNPKNSISAKDNEYLQIENIIVNVYTNDQIIL